MLTGPSDPTPTSPNDAVAGFCLTLPGRTLYLKALLAAKKFRNRGNKGAIAAFYQLEEEGLGKIFIVGGSASKTAQVFHNYILIFSLMYNYHNIFAAV